MSNRIVAAYFQNRRHKLILDKSVSKALQMLTGRISFNEIDKQALALLGVELIHVEDMAKGYKMAGK